MQSSDTVGELNAPVIRTHSLPKRKSRRVLAGILIFLTACLLFLWYIGVFGGNIRTVIPGQYYRSAQITGHNLNTVLDEDQIKTVINLRGGSTKDAWYRSELASCQERDVKHVDVPLSAVKLPPPDRLKLLLNAFDQTKPPYLVHCRGGSDRTGLATTLYLHLYRNVPLDLAQQQGLSWRYAHFRQGQAHPMDDFFDLYRKTGNGMSLRDWILTLYPAVYDKIPAKDKIPGKDLTPGAPVNADNLVSAGN